MYRCFTLWVLATTFVCLPAAPRLARSELPGNGGSAIYLSDCSEFIVTTQYNVASINYQL